MYWIVPPCNLNTECQVVLMIKFQRRSCKFILIPHSTFIDMWFIWFLILFLFLFLLQFLFLFLFPCSCSCSRSCVFQFLFLFQFLFNQQFLMNFCQIIVSRPDRDLRENCNACHVLYIKGFHDHKILTVQYFIIQSILCILYKRIIRSQDPNSTDYTL